MKEDELRVGAGDNGQFTLHPPRQKVKEGSSVGHSVMSNSLQPNGLCSSPGSCPWNSPDKNTGVGCHSFLQEIFLTQGSIPGLPHCRQVLYRLSHLGSPETGTLSLPSRVRVNPPSRGCCGPRSSQDPLFPSISQDTRARVSQ